MSPWSRTRLLALALTAFALPALAACGAGFDASVDEVTGHNADGEVNGILARDIVVVKAAQATSAALAGTLINSGHRPDVLQTVSFTDDAPGSQTVTISPNLNLAAGQLVPLGAGSTAPISIPDAHAITVGDFVYVNMHFAQAGDMHMQVAAADRSFYFSSIGAVPTPTAATTQGDAAGRGAFGTRITSDRTASANTAKPKPTAPAATPAAKQAPKPAGPAALKAAPPVAKQPAAAAAAVPGAPSKQAAPAQPAPAKQSAPAKQPPAEQPAPAAKPPAAAAAPAPAPAPKPPAPAVADPAAAPADSESAPAPAAVAKADPTAVRPR